ncbi:hypothetical protein HJC23_004909 [Cyclotella cryptica]|uniref:Uncharacterized protein n=1 Tax=Cyclotella cryptica TaxID=29204 RepID=A0ABD3PT08_9STRA|eukprot:CCRYP_011847-RA/>CCRYP_011847-RA protein AED:0.39 eAED:0.39 QI:0/-1/0/1/-1/1/1/0/335
MPQQTLLTKQTNLSPPSEALLHRVHALLGVFVLLHLCYRYTRFFKSNDDDMGFDDKDLFLASNSQEMQLNSLLYFGKCFLPHLSLQLSGFGFRLPTKRHPDGNRIWPQYRYEALVFCLRCLFLAFLAWKRKVNKQTLDSSCSIMPAAIVVGCTMISADLIGRHYRSQPSLQSSNTIRGLSAPKWATSLMSTAQFHATVHCLLTSDRLSVQIAALNVVQTSAFGMALRRKQFISQREGVILYGFVLGLGMLVIFDDLTKRSLFHFATILGNITAITRMYLGVNKYVLWTLTVVVLSLLKQNTSLFSDSTLLSLELKVWITITSWLFLFGVCFEATG